MTSHRIPEIPLIPLKRISPSRFTALQACQLREIWQSQTEVAPLLPGATSAKLGSIIHKMLELTFKGLVFTDNDIVEKWEEEVRTVEQAMRGNPLEAGLVPLSQSRNYELKRYRCFSLLRNIINRKHNAGLSCTTTSHPEVWIETPDKKVGGKVDLIRQSPSGIQIVDFKTGIIIDELSNTVKSVYQNQIKLYGGLYHAAYGSWPTRLTLVGLDRAEVDVTMSPDEAEYLLRTAKNLLDKINLNVSNNSQEFFASPTPINCSHCNFRPACSKYWCQRTDYHAWPTDIIGQVTNVQVSPVGYLKVDINQSGRIIKVRGLEPEKFSLLNGNIREVCLCNLIIDPSPGFYIPTKSTTSYLVN